MKSKKFWCSSNFVSTMLINSTYSWIIFGLWKKNAYNHFIASSIFPTMPSLKKIWTTKLVWWFIQRTLIIKKTLTPSILNVINLDAFFLGKIIKKHHGINQNALQIIKSGPSITHYKDNNKGVFLPIFNHIGMYGNPRLLVNSCDFITRKRNEPNTLNQIFG